MTRLNFKWVKRVAQYSTGEYLYLNKIRLAGYHWNSARSQGTKDDSTDWTGEVDLPFLKTQQVYAESEEEIKAKVEEIVTSWFSEALTTK